MSFDELSSKRIEKEMKTFIEKHRPPVEIRNEFDIGFKMEKYSVIIFEIRPKWNNPDEKQEIPVAKATFTKTINLWKMFYMRSDLKWHKYDPLPEVKTVGEFLSEVDEDKFGCFWG